MTIKLPKDFFFGAAMSGPQTEGAWNVGGRLRSYWDMYSDQEINAFFNNVGSYVGNDMYHKYEEDIKNSRRFSPALLCTYHIICGNSNNILEILAADRRFFHGFGGSAGKMAVPA